MTLLNGIKQNNSLRIVFITVSYVALAQAALLLSFPESKSIGVWFPSGLALGMIIIFGTRVWPAISIGSLIANMMLFLHYSIPFSIESVATITLNAGFGTLEPLFAYSLLNRFVRGNAIFKRTSHVFIFILIAILTSFLGGALVSLGVSANNIITEKNFVIYLFKYGAANLVAIFIFTPLIVSWSNSFQLSISRKILIETLLFFVALAVVLSSLLIDAISTTIVKSSSFLLMPFIFWLAFRANKQIITLGIFILTLAALYLTIHQSGPFAFELEAESILVLQIFLSIMGITALIINTTVQERTIAERELKLFNEKLEQRVKERTKELKEEINTRKATEEKIKISNKKLRKVNSELDNFVYSVSHDLRAPIASVLGLVNLAKKENSIKEMRKYLDMVAKSAEQQDAFIKDILDLSRNARLDVVQDTIKFEDIINNTFDQYQYMDNGKIVTKEVEIDQKVPFQSDTNRIKVILNNLISNAIRHSEGNVIVVGVHIKVNDDMASITIKDDGKGIRKQHLDHIFKMFYRATDTTAGSGLGLYIVKETIDKLRGAIQIDSKENEGTTVKLDIPNLYDKQVNTEVN